jgi:hypothetical protein
MLWLIVALIATLQPLLHIHPLTSDSGRHETTNALQCGLCVHAQSDAVPQDGTIARPEAISENLLASPRAAVRAAARLSLPSRAPPAA